jgi:hypothetical protein
MSASQWFFEQCRLTQWGREPGFVAPKPLSAREIKKLGAALDRAEIERGDNDASRHRFYVLAMEYGTALAARNLYKRCKLENSTRIPTNRDAIKLRNEMHAAMIRIDELDDLGPEFSTRREFLDANSASAFAISAYEISEQKYQSDEAAARRRNAADRASNVIYHRPSRKPVEVHL